MAVTRIKNNQITDLTVNAAQKLQDYTVTSAKIANNLTYNSSLTVAGNLTVQGNVTAIDTHDLVVEDPLILLAKDQVGTPTLDIGYIGVRGDEINIAMVWDESAGQFVTAFTTDEVTNTTITISSYASLQTGNLAAGNVTFSGTLDVTGNVTLGNLQVDPSSIIDAGNNRISNVAEPVANSDAATKSYVDSQSAQGFTIEDDTANTTTVSGGDTLQLLGTTNEVEVLITNVDQITFGLPANVTISDGLTVTNGVSAGSVTSSGNITGNNIISNNDVTTATVTASGNVAGGNITTVGQVAATGNVSGGNVSSAGTIDAVGTATVGNLATAGTVTASGNITGNNIVSNNDVTTATVTASGNVSAGNISSANEITAVTMTASGNVSGNNIVSNNDVTTATVTASGNVTGGNLVTTGNVDAGNVLASSNITAVGNVTASYLIAIDGLVANGNITATDLFVGNITANGYANIAGNVTVGNLLSNNLIEGTDIIASGNVDAVIVNTGNIYSGNLSINATGNVYMDILGNLDMNSRWINDLPAPVQSSDAATKQYVDDAVSSGITIHDPVYLETPTALTPVTYTQGGTTATVTQTIAGNTVVFSSAINPQINDQLWFANSFAGLSGNTAYFVVGTPNTSAAVLSATYNGAPLTTIANASVTESVRINSGQGATLTANVAGNLVVDGIQPTAGQRILVYNQTPAYENGVYVVTDPGSVSNVWVLTRSADMNTYIPDDINGVDAGDYFFIQAGVTGAGESYVMTAPVGPVIIGYDPLTFTQFSASSTYSANTQAGLSLNGTIFSAKVDQDTTAFDFQGNIIVKAGANLVSPNIGDATGNSLTLSGNGLLSASTVSTGNLSVTDTFTANNFSATGNITGNNIISNNDVTTATVTASGNVAAGNLTTVGNVEATGNVSGGNVTTPGEVIAVGNVAGGNLTTTGNIDAAGNIAGGNVVVPGEVIAVGNVSGGNLTTVGNVVSGNVVTTGNVDAANATITGNVTVQTVLGNIEGTYANFTGNITAGNISGNLSGNITAAGNSTQVQYNLDGVLGANASFTFNETGNGTLSVAYGNGGNIQADFVTVGVNLFSNGTIESSGNISSVSGNINALSGNISGGNIVSTNDVTTVTVTASGNITAGNIAVTGTSTLGNVVIAGNDITNPTANVVTINSAGEDVDLIVSGNTVANLFIVDAGSDSVLIGNGTPTTDVAFKIGTTNSMMVPVGNTVERPAVGEIGMLRFNTTEDVLEYYDSNSWNTVVGDYTVIVADDFNGDGVTTAFTLSQNSTTAGTVVSINGVVQIPVTAYSVAGNVLTFTEAPESTDVIDARIFTTTTSVTQLQDSGVIVDLNPGAGSVDFTGNLIPSANVTYNLGNTTNFWNNLYLAGNTIYLGNLELKELSNNTFGIFTNNGAVPADMAIGNIEVAAIEQGTTLIGITAPNGNAYVTVNGVSDVLVVGTSGITVTGDATVTGDVTAQNVNSLSDAALKTNINPLIDVDSVIDQLRGVEYDWRNGAGHSYGFLAHEVEEVLPDAVRTGADGLKSINYTSIIPFLVETIKQLRADIAEIKRRLD